MLTGTRRDVIDPCQLAAFEHDARPWLPWVQRFGGLHHGYVAPSEEVNNIALARFSLPGMAACEHGRHASLDDAGCQAAFACAGQARCIARHARSVMRPLLAGGVAA